MNSSVWIVSANSESGDDYGVIAVYKQEPTENELRELTSEKTFGADGWCAEDESGPGIFGSYLHLTIQQWELM